MTTKSITSKFLCRSEHGTCVGTLLFCYFSCIVLIRGKNINNLLTNYWYTTSILNSGKNYENFRQYKTPLKGVFIEVDKDFF